ncbi:MAG: DUF58 domain-containing protein [Planctomycetota bacterium]
MRVRLEITPLGATALALFHISSGAALLTGDRTAQLAASLLFAPIAIDVLDKVRRRPKLALTSPPARVEARRPFLDRIHLRNGRSTMFGLQLRADRGSGSTRSATVDSLAREEEREVSIPSRGLRRGRYEDRIIEIRTGHPLGLWRWRATPRLDAVLVVEPARESLPAHAQAALDGDQAQRRPRRDGDPEMFHSMRELRAGEDARRVHALRSATVGRPVVRVDQALADDRWTVVLDLRRAPGAVDGSRRREFERQLGRVANVIDLAVQRGVELTLTVIGAETTHYNVERPATAKRALEVLAMAQPVEYRTLDVDDIPRGRQGGSLWISAQGCSDATVRSAVQSDGFVEVQA